VTQNPGSLRRHEVDPERFGRLVKNLVALLNDLINEANETAARSEARRKKVFVDLRALLDEIPAPDQGIVLTRLEHEVQGAFDEQGSPKVSVDAGSGACVGRPGGRVDANLNGTTVGACATVEGGKVTGGGVQASVSY
jgi:hypothetical protein